MRDAVRKVNWRIEMNRFVTWTSAVALALVTMACAQTDAGVTSSVKAKFAADDVVKAYKVEVDTRDHVVYLSGDVENEAVREHAVRIAKDTDGVRDVVDELRVVGTSGTLDYKIEEKADDVGDDIKDGAKATGNAIEKGAEATADGAKKVGGTIKDAVTDKDRDSDNDGR